MLSLPVCVLRRPHLHTRISGSRPRWPSPVGSKEVGRRRRRTGGGHRQNSAKKTREGIRLPLAEVRKGLNQGWQWRRAPALGLRTATYRWWRWRWAPGRTSKRGGWERVDKTEECTVKLKQHYFGDTIRS